MNEIIRKRKSIRKYSMTPLGNDILAMIRSEIENIKPLFDNIEYSIEIGGTAKGLFGVTAPHYLLFFSEEKEGFLLNIGYIGEKISLFLSENEIGSCWLGAVKPLKEGPYPFVIGMAFGLANEEIFRNDSDFKRKPLSKISEGDDPRLEAARLAPSAMNLQNWYFIATNGKIHCHIKKGDSASRLRLIDLGIALAHISTESESFTFIKEENIPEVGKFKYIGTVI